MEVFYSFQNGFSGEILFEEWIISSFNIFFTLLPPLAIGIFEQHATKSSLLNVPELYKTGPSGKLFNTKVFATWAVNAVYHCCLLYFLVIGAYVVTPPPPSSSAF
jgi:phospholipid-transporting ATPase